MKKFLLFIVMVCSMNFVMAQTQTSATYSAGDIPVSFGAYDATCNGPVTPLVVNIPAGDFVFSVDVVYDMLAQGGAYMSEQRSQIYCQDTGLGEGMDDVGTGFTGGTWSYSRTGLTFAEGVDADGILTFEMQAWRTWGGTLCDMQYQLIPSGTWTITVNHGPPPTCLFPNGLTTANATGATVDFGWTENGTATAWDVEVVPAGSAPTGTPTHNDVTTNPFTIPGLVSGTDYDFYVRADCGMDDTDVSVWSSPLFFMNSYCTPAPTSVDGNGITNVAMGVINNATGAEPGNYGDYTALSTDAPQGLPLAIDITLETGFTYNLWAWVDWNNDLDFTDPGEEFYLGESPNTNPTTFNASITVPLTASLGTHVIRLGGADSGLGNTSPSNPCYAGAWSSFEDYTVNVIAPPACQPVTNIALTALTATSVDVAWTAVGSETVWDIEVVEAGNAPTGIPTFNDVTNPYSITTLNPSTTQTIYVRADCGMDDTDVSIWISSGAFTTPCVAITTFPACEDFATNGIPNCWEMTGNADWEFSTGAAYGAAAAGDHTIGGGTNYAWMDGSDAGPGSFYTLTTPQYDVSSLTNPYLSYWVFSNNIDNPGDNNTLFVEMYDGINWIPVETIIGDNPAWLEYGVDVNAVGALAGNIVQFRFLFESTAGTDFNNDILIDDVCMEEAPACPTPSSLTVTNVTATTADLDFNYSGAGTEFIIEYGPIGFIPGTGAGTEIVMNMPPPFTITGLPSSSDLQIFVKEVCGIGDESDYAGPATIQTACIAIATFPACEDFAANGIPNCWSMVGPADWEFSTAAAYGAAAAGDHTIGGGTNYAWMDGSDAGPGNLYELYTPFYDVSSLTNPYLSYWVFSNNIDNPGENNTLYVEMYDGANWIPVETIIGDNPAWLEYGIDVNAVATLTGSVIQFRFVFESTAAVNDFNNDILLDDVCMEEAPSCPNPSSLTVTNVTATTADLDFNYSGAGTEFIVEYGPIGFIPGTGAGTEIVVNMAPPFTVTGLPSSSDLQIFVKEVCAIGDESDYAGPVTIQTACVAITTFPACEDFTANGIPNCWSMVGPADWEFSTNADYGAAAAGDHTMGGGTNYAWMDGSDAGPGNFYELYTPFYDVSSLNAPYLSYWVFSNNTDNPGDNNTLTVELWDGANWVLAETIQGDDPNWIEYTIDVNQLSTVTGDIQFRFIFESTAAVNDFNNDILIDDICLKELPLNDLGVTEIIAPTSGCGLGVEDVTIEITNLGFNTQGGFFTGYSVNGVVQTAIPDGFISANVVSGATEIHTFTTQYDFSVEGSYVVKAWTSLAGDSDATNDTTTVVINNIAVSTATLPYFEDFETSDGGFVATNESATAAATWEWGAPTGAVINTAGSGVNSWVTNLDGNYENNTLTYLTAPCMDFSGLIVDPELSFALRTDSENNFDGTFVEMSLDGGNTWNTLGSDADTDWYNNIDQQFQGDNLAWTVVTHTIDGAAGQGSVRLRFGFSSDGSASAFDGGAIDDVSIIDVCAAGFNLAANVTDESVEGMTTDGSATITADAGSAYTYAWSNGGTTDTQTGLEAGTYYVTVTNSIGCIDELEVIVDYTCIADLIGDVSYTEEAQNGTTNDGSITVTANTSTGPYTFDWSTGTQTMDPAGVSTETGLTAGLYYVTVTDGNGCSAVDSIVVTAFCPVNLGATSIAVGESIDGAADGTATVTPSVGVEPFTFAWSNGGDTDTQTDLAAGTYDVTITDANGCTEVVSVMIDFTCPTSIGASATGFDETLQGANDGAGTATASAGTPPYQFDWSNGATGNTVINLAPGSYDVTVTDANGCMEMTSIMVNASGLNTAIENIESLSSFSVSPNPTSGETVLSVQFTENVDLRVEVISVIGQTINSLEYTQTTREDIMIDLSNVPSGMYFVRLSVGDAIHTDRIVKK